MAANQREVVREFIAPQDGEVGEKNVRSQVIDKAWNLKTRLSRFIRNHVEVVVIPLHAGLILCGWGELVIPADLEIVVVGVNRTARRESSQGLHVGRLFEIVSISVGYGKLIIRFKTVIEGTCCKVFPG